MICVDFYIAQTKSLSSLLVEVNGKQIIPIFYVLTFFYINNSQTSFLFLYFLLDLFFVTSAAILFTLFILKGLFISLYKLCLLCLCATFVLKGVRTQRASR